MSQPYAALAQVTIDKAALIAYLAARPQSAAQWSDWRRLGDNWPGLTWDEDLSGFFAEADRWLGASYRDAVRGVLKASEAPELGRCRYDQASQQFTFGTLTYSENLIDFVTFFAAARGLSGHLRDPQSGFALVRTFIWGKRDDTVAVMGLAQGHSNFLDRGKDAPAYEQHVRDAVAVFDDIYQVYAGTGEPGIHDPQNGPAAATSAIDDLERLR